MTTTDDQIARISDLEAEVERLQTELEKRDRRQQKLAHAAVGAGGWFLLGPELRSSLKTWLEAKSLRGPLPAGETAGVLAAIVRRVVRVGAVAVVLALLHGEFLVWQNLLIRTQIEQQAADTLIVRKAQLLATIYEVDNVDCKDMSTAPNEIPHATNHEPGSPSKGGDCVQPRAGPRAREEAVRAYLGLELHKYELPDLTDANLANLKLWNINFRAAYLSGADLTNTHLNNADLVGVKFWSADLTDAKLSGANLAHASFTGADLTNTDLTSANLAQWQIESASGDHTTQLPLDLKMPSHWLEAHDSAKKA